MTEQFTSKAQEAVSSAVQSAQAAGNPQVDSLHLLEALLEQGEGIAYSLLQAIGANPALARAMRWWLCPQLAVRVLPSRRLHVV